MSITIDQIKQTLALRSIGLSVPAITEKTGVSPSTIRRLVKRHDITKGSALAKLVEEQQTSMLVELSNDEYVRFELAKLVADDLAIARQIRKKLSDCVEGLSANNTDQLANHLRGLNSASSALATTQKIIRTAIGADSGNVTPEELPELIISELTAEDITALRKEQQAILQDAG